MIVLLGEKSVVPSGLHNGGSVTGGSASLTPGCNLSSRWDLKNEPCRMNRARAAVIFILKVSILKPARIQQFSFVPSSFVIRHLVGT